MRNLIAGIIFLIWLLLGWFYYSSSNSCCDDTSAKIGIDDTTRPNAAEELNAKSSTELDEAKIIVDKQNAVESDSKGESDVAGEKNTNNTAELDEAKSTANNQHAVESKPNGPLLFNYSDVTPDFNDIWADRKASLLNGLQANQILQITGDYHPDEINNTDFENLGLARADAIQRELGLTKDAVQIKSRQTNKNWKPGEQFVAVNFRNLIKTKQIDETIDDKIIIRFGYNSTQKLDSKEVEEYLDKLASRIKKSGEKVSITGHSDSAGSAATNVDLGHNRANIIKNYLRSKSVPANQISTDSKGETDPISSNSTKQGRSDNRRAELVII